MNKKMNNLDIKMGGIARHGNIALIIAILCFGIGVVAAIPQQDYTLYGTATLNGKVLTAQDNAVVSLKVDGIELVSYTMGDIPNTDNYVLKVPMDSDSSVTTAAQEGDTAPIYIDGIAINEGAQIIGAPGTTVKFDIFAASASNPPSVTVRYPNGGESISIGTQVQVSAHATDDVKVTGVTFYYSRDGGSNWNFIGEGVKVSGTDKEGVWNITWNTAELSAGSNYMIKAVASDGTSTSEGQSDSTFSLTPSKVIRVPDDYPTIQAAIDAASSGYNINVSSGTYFEHLVIDKPLKLIGGDKNTTIINGSKSGYCVHVTADNVEIGGFRIENGYNGVYLESSNGSIIDNNIISDHGIGVSLNDSNNNLIAHNSLSNNMLQLCAIHLFLSNNNVISENDIFENGAGVFLYDSNHNLIYHNNFINNQKQAYDSTGTNSWDKGPVEGGNYWSDHGCVGNPSDKPYSIYSDGIDHYPFQDPNGWLKGISDGNTIKNTIGMEFVPIPAGEFEMGSPSDEGSVHHVNIGYAFYMGRYEVTQKQWRAIMGDNPSYFKGDDLPVEQVSWYGAQEFIKKLNEKESTDKYRLPSEAEWEYACRAGTTSRYSFGDSESNLGDYAWYGDNSGDKTHPVGQKKANPWGLYDMHGNVWEWVHDAWHSDYNGAPTDGSAWEDPGTIGVLRGGGWRHDARRCRSASRDPGYPSYRGNFLGFRLLKEP